MKHNSVKKTPGRILDIRSASTHVTTSPQREKDSHQQDLWDKFWALEAAGTEEFSNSEREEQALVDKQVWDNTRKQWKHGKTDTMSDFPGKISQPCCRTTEQLRIADSLAYGTQYRRMTTY